jgi:hypothetical protein
MESQRYGPGVHTSQHRWWDTMNMLRRVVLLGKGACEWSCVWLGGRLRGLLTASNMLLLRLRVCNLAHEVAFVADIPVKSYGRFISQSSRYWKRSQHNIAASCTLESACIREYPHSPFAGLIAPQ